MRAVAQARWSRKRPARNPDITRTRLLLSLFCGHHVETAEINRVLAVQTPEERTSVSVTLNSLRLRGLIRHVEYGLWEFPAQVATKLPLLPPQEAAAILKTRATDRGVTI